MHAATSARGTARATIAVLAFLCAATPAAAQCVITGPAAICGSGAQLCGPAGNYSYTWSGPNGFLETSACVTVTEPGSYALSVIDLGSGMFLGFCTTTIGAGATPPAPVVEGPASACPGDMVTLCGPDLGYGFLWTGPSGTAGTRCVTADGPGTWTLALVDLASGCTGPAATHVVEPALCSSFSACPRPPAFWARGCRRMERFRFSPEQMAELAARVDERSSLFAWEEPLADLCATLNPRRPTLRDRARRQLAGTYLNVCAWEARMVPAFGEPVGLDPAATFADGATSSTVASWLAAAEQRLLALEGQPLERKAVREAYRALIQQAWKLNHAEGLDSPCRSEAPPLEPARMIANDDDSAAEEPLEAQLAWELERAGVAVERVAPNPTSGRASVSFTVGGTAPQQVTVSVHDIAGRRLALLHDGVLAPGAHAAAWDGRDGDGRPVRPGTYFVRARGDVAETRATITIVR